MPFKSTENILYPGSKNWWHCLHLKLGKCSKVVKEWEIDHWTPSSWCLLYLKQPAVMSQSWIFYLPQNACLKHLGHFSLQWLSLNRPWAVEMEDSVKKFTKLCEKNFLFILSNGIESRKGWTEAVSSSFMVPHHPIISACLKVLVVYRVVKTSLLWS